jgi:hypothetical protein
MTPAGTSIVLLASVLISSAPLAGQDQPTTAAAAPPIATDRPSVTDSSVVVPAGSIQVENGFLDTSSQALRTLDGPESLIRFGLFSKTELRFYVPNYYYNQAMGMNAGPVPGAGFGDIAIGVKQQLGPTPGKFHVSVVAYVSLPTGARSISSHGYDPAVQAPWSRALTPKWGLGGMLSLYCPTQDGKRNFTFEPTIVLNRQLTAPWSAFVEYAGDFYQRGGPRDLLHFGTALSISPQQQLDFHTGVGSLAGTTYYLLGFGYSFRIQVVRQR